MKTPEFIKIPIFGFEIADKSFKFVKLKEKTGGIVVDTYGEGEIPTGVIERGIIKKSDILRALIKDIVDANNISFVALALPEEHGFVRNLKIANVADDELRQALELQLEEHIPLPPSEIVFDYKISNREKDHLDIVLTAFPKQLVDAYIEIFSSSKAKVALLESEMRATASVVIPNNIKDVAIIMDWGKVKITFGIAEGQTLKFASTVQVGGNALDETIAKNLGIDLKRAEELKKKTGFLASKDALPVFQSIVPVLTAIKEEAEKYINFWQTHSESRRSPKRLYLIGGNANLTGLDEHLSKELGIEVVLGDPWVNLSFPKYYLPTIEYKESLRFSTSVGLALAGLKMRETI